MCMWMNQGINMIQQMNKLSEIRGGGPYDAPIYISVITAVYITLLQ